MSAAIHLDLDAARRHIERLTGSADSVVTLMGIAHGDDRPPSRRGTVTALWPWVDEQQARGAGVYVTVNQTSGRGRKSTDVQEVRAVWVDDDEPRASHRTEWPLEPSLIIETSPGNFHYYWMTHAAPGPEFDDVMGCMVAHHGCDNRAKDSARVLRLAGTLHLKNPEQPFQVRIVSDGPAGRYSWDEIKTKFPPAVDPGGEMATDKKLPFPSSMRMSFNAAHTVQEMLQRHGYICTGNRWAPAGSTHPPGIRQVPGKDGLFRSEHAKDVLPERFDAWVAHVVLNHGGDVAKAEAALQVEGFDDQLPAPGDSPVLPSFKRTKTGAIEATKENVVKGLSRDEVCGFKFRHDSFKDGTMLAEGGTEYWRAMKDTDYTELCIRLERGGFQPINKELIRDAVAYVADANTFDSAQYWLTRLEWDGVARIEHFLAVYLGAEDTPYTRAVALYLWTALAGRTLQPGIKCDMAPVLVGPQGTRKSSAVAALAPDDEFFTRIDLGTSDDNMARQMRGKLVGELDELRGLSTRDADHVKSVVTRTFEEWTPKYREMTVRYLRRIVFFGTSNRDDFLSDETGNRRWLPFRCGLCDTDAIARDRTQLWAEARERFTADGVLYREAERLANAEHAAYAEHDEWDNTIRAWLHAPEFGERTPYGREFLTSGEVLREALSMPNAQHNRMHTSRVKKSLIRLGYSDANIRINGERKRGFVPPSLF